MTAQPAETPATPLPAPEPGTPAWELAKVLAEARIYDARQAARTAAQQPTGTRRSA